MIVVICWCSSASGSGRGCRITGKRVRATLRGCRSTTRSASHERLLVRLGDGSGVRDAGVSLFLFVWRMRMRIPTDGRRHHRSRVGARRAARRQCARCRVWWMVISAGAFLFGAVYLSCIRASAASRASSAGLRRVSSSDDAAANGAQLEARLAPLAHASASSSSRRIRSAVGIGHRLYLDNCAACHGMAGAWQPRCRRARSHRRRLAVRRRQRHHPHEHPRWPHRRHAAAGRRARSQRHERRGVLCS